MKSLKLIALLAIATVAATGCSMTVPVGATGNDVGSKVGEASGKGFLMFLNFGVDASVQSAAKNGGITKISTVDYKVDNMAGLMQTYTCIVTGE